MKLVAIFIREEQVVKVDFGNPGQIAAARDLRCSAAWPRSSRWYRRRSSSPALIQRTSISLIGATEFSIIGLTPDSTSASEPAILDVRGGVEVAGEGMRHTPNIRTQNP